MSWTALAILAAGAYAFKAAGFVAFQMHTPSEAILRVVRLLPPALLGALIVVQTFSTADQLVLDPRAAGVAAGAIAAWKKAPFIVVLVAAAATTAAIRAVTS